MTGPRFWLWFVPALVWGAFALWYTDFSGPLTEAERQQFLERFERGAADPARLANLRRFMAEDTGNQFVMVNVLDVADNPAPLPATGPGASGADLLDHYMAFMFPALLARACHPIYIGRAVADALDIEGIDGARHWEQAALMRYRSRRDMLEISSNPVFRERHDYKLGGLDKTIAFPVEGVLYYHDLRLLLALLLFALTALIDMLVFRRRV